MKDKELLQAAANAANVKVGRHLAITDGLLMANDLYWNPLVDDGDALRLAVRLSFLIDTHGLYARVYFPYEQSHLVHELMGNDKEAATRRAIVRAAADLGRYKIRKFIR